MTEDFFSYELLKEISSEVGRHPVRFYKRTRLRPEVQRRFSENDIRELLILAAASGASVLPRRYWDRFTRYTSSLRYRHQYKKKFARFAKTMRTVFLIDSQAELEALFRSHHEMIHRRRMMLAIDRLASRRNPEIDLRGADLLRAALEQGNGAIVWAFQFSNQSLAGKRALWEQGFRPVHVSSYIHGL
ncbi:hypothetical protein [Hoeflea sp.]|uniref:hypothetical protein n=1 Tax=Hoeflea sp. TaxID=1940281 RepID=UPI003B01CDDA